MRYTLGMETVVLVVLALVVALVAIDAIGRLDERRPRRGQEARRDRDLDAEDHRRSDETTLTGHAR